MERKLVEIRGYIVSDTRRACSGWCDETVRKDRIKDK